MDLGCFKFLSAGVIGGAPQAEASTRCGAASTSCALIRRSSGNFSDEQGVDTPAGIEYRRARKPGIDHRADAGDGERGFSDVGRDDDLRPVGRADGLFLLAGWECGVERKNIVWLRRGDVCNQFDGAADFMGAGEKYEDIAGFGKRESLAGERCRLFPRGGFALRPGLAVGCREAMGTVKDLDGESASASLEFRHRLHVFCKRIRFQCGRHHDQAEIGACAVL